PPLAVTANEDAVFLAGSSGTIERIDPTTGKSTMLANNAGVYVIRADSKNVYFTTATAQGKGQLVAIPVGGGSPVGIAESDDAIDGLWVDELGVVWTTRMPPAIWQLAK